MALAARHSTALRRSLAGLLPLRRLSTEALELTEPQMAAYKTAGWCVPSYRLPSATLAGLRDALNRLLAVNASVRPEDLVNAHLEDGSEQAHGITGDSAFLRHGADPALTSLASALIGKPGVILWGCHIFCKMPGEGRRVPFHQDAPYWPIEPMEATTIWVALDDSKTTNGCLQVLPGSHVKGELPHEACGDDAALGAGVRQDLLADLPEPQAVELEAGQLSAHDTMLVHGSDANSSSRRRAGITYLYMSADSHFNREGLKPASQGFGYESRPLFWVRGDHINPKNTHVHDLRQK
mmetsp:Transcript_33426/g.59409  ORF Transcript_33426/g.59409 Transcript_33426/m.59409 type:complete len:295 (-) Transcript_33426:70-954(-)